MDKKRIPELIDQIDDKYILDSEIKPVSDGKVKKRIGLYSCIAVGFAAAALMIFVITNKIRNNVNTGTYSGAVVATEEVMTIAAMTTTPENNETVKAETTIPEYYEWVPQGRVIRINTDSSGMSYVPNTHPKGKIVVVIDNQGPVFVDENVIGADDVTTGDLVKLIGDEILIEETYPGRAVNVNEIVLIERGYRRDVQDTIDSLIELGYSTNVTCDGDWLYEGKQEGNESETTIGETTIGESEIDELYIVAAYAYEKGGFKGEGDFDITLQSDGYFSLYEGLLSSYVGYGRYEILEDTLVLHDEGRGNIVDYYFSIVDDAIIFNAKKSGGFTYVNVPDGGKFISRSIPKP